MTVGKFRNPQILIAERVFDAWSSGDADAPQPFFHPDGVLSDIVGGEHTGWPAIRHFFASGLQVWPDLRLIPADYWTSPTGVALRWTMSATVTNAAIFGEAAVGKRWTSEGMSWLVIEDGLIRREVDYHDSAAATRSLGISKTR